MTGSGPLGREPAGTFNFEPPPPGQALYIEPSAKRIRVVVGGETVADSHATLLVQESGQQPVHYFPPQDVRRELLTPTERHTSCPKKGIASYYTIDAGGRTVESGAWYYPEPIPGAARLAGHIAFYWNRMDAWFEEAEQIYGHPRDPYHRLDVRQADRHVQISHSGETLADSRSAVALFESNLPVRWYLPREDVGATLLPSETSSICPYKGTASYHSVRLSSGETVTDLVWFYSDPFPEAAPIRDLVCFYNEHVDLRLDGELQPRPISPWSKGQNRPPAQTRG